MPIGGLMRRWDLETYPLLVWLRSLACSIFLRLVPTLTSSAVPVHPHPGRRGALVAGVARDGLVGSISSLSTRIKGINLSWYSCGTDLF